MASTGRSVARTLGPAVWRLGLLVAVMAVIAITGVVVATHGVSDLTEDLGPAASANQDLFQDMTALDASVSAWARSGDPGARAAFSQQLVRLPHDRLEVSRYAASDASLDLVVARQEQAIDTWLQDYAQPRVAAPGGPDTFQMKRYRTGQRLFTAIEAAHQQTAAAFDQRVRDASTEAGWRLKGTIVSVAVVALLAWFALSRARRRLLHDVSEPLVDLEQTVQQMAKDPTLRAHPDGPREVRSIAEALNELADAQARARAVEAKIATSLQTLDTARDDFVSNVSHELRTPLTTISGYLEMIAEEFEGQMQPRHERVLEASRRNVARLGSLIDDLLTLSKAEGRRVQLEPADLVPVVRDAVTDVRITAARRGIRVDLAVPEAPVVVEVDRPMLGRALLNLLSNAVKFSHVDGAVEVQVTPLVGSVEVQVIDHGLGIPAAELERLGTRFFRASNAVTHEIAGTGLGLRIVQTIVDQHGGDLRLESTEGEGTRVVLRLPLSERPLPEPPTAQDDPAVEVTAEA